MTAERDVTIRGRADVQRTPHVSSLRGLDWLNFFLADVQSGVGAFLAIYLATSGWNEEQVGIALTVGGIAGILAQLPAGALVDHLHSKRLPIACGATILAVAGLTIAWVPLFWPVIACEIVAGAGGSVLVPAVCAISLGLVGRGAFDQRQGRNQSFNSAGNVAAAVVIGALGYLLSNRSIFYFVAALTLPTLLALRAIRPGDIDYRIARGGEPREVRGAATLSGVPAFRRTFAVFSLCSVMFHFANAAMLSLLGEMLAKNHPRSSMMYMSACVVTTQLIITLSAPWVSVAAGRWGRKPPLLVAFAVLPLRGVLYTLTGDPAWLISIQILDGVAASIFGVVSILVIADISQGSGRFNLTIGGFGTAIGIGAAVSQFAGGSIAHRSGYHAGFYFLASVAALALLMLATLMPETKRGTAVSSKSYTAYR